MALEIRGSESNEILFIASPLDIHPTVFSLNGASYTEAFSLMAFVIRQKDRFDLAVERSFGDMLEEYLGWVNP
jgi:sarcosine oxidase gamma subunit